MTSTVCLCTVRCQTQWNLAEERLIARDWRPIATHPGALGLVDDAAVLSPPPGCDLVLKTDGVIAGVHFFPNDPAEDIGRKALRMNFSDLAAKGAKPLGFLLSLAMAAGTDETWISAFASGLGEDALHYGCPLLGGDTDHTAGPTTVSIAAFGTVPHGRTVRRSTAKVGDCVVVTGTIGDAALGVKVRGDAGLSVHGGSRQRWLPIWNNAISCRSRATPSLKRCCSTRQRRWMFPTGLSATSPSCAAPQRSRPRSMWHECRYLMPRKRQSPPTRRCSKQCLPAATIMKSC